MATDKIEKDIYGGKYVLMHNPTAKGRAPRYTITNKETGEVIKPKGITTILGQTLSKDLMKWAVDCCVNYLKDKLPVITEEDLAVGADEYNRLRNAGGSTGTEAHGLVEKFLNNQEPGGLVPAIEIDTSISEEAKNAYRAFVKWFEEIKPEVLGVEQSIFSEQFEYCGTFDGLMKIDGKVYLTDLKTTNPSRKAPNGVYAENFIQLGAYSMAYKEELSQGGEMPEIDDLMVISAKKNGVLDIVKASDLGLSVEECEDMAKRVINIFHFMNYTTNKLGGK